MIFIVKFHSCWFYLSIFACCWNCVCVYWECLTHISLYTNVFGWFRQLELLNEDSFVSFPWCGSSGGRWRIRRESAACEFQSISYLYNGLKASRGRCFCFYFVTEKAKGWRGQVGQKSFVILKWRAAAECSPSPHHELGTTEQGAAGVDGTELRDTHTHTPCSLTHIFL